MSETSTPHNLGLRIVQLGADAEEWAFCEARTIQIGRSPENDICLAHRSVSRFHAVVFQTDEGWECACLGRNGMFVEERRVVHCAIEESLTIQMAQTGPKLRFIVERATAQPAESCQTEPVTEWLLELGAGRETAAGKLWNHYYDHVVRLARARLGSTPRRAFDEEDVAVNVLDRLFRNLRDKQLALSDREQLWQLLVVMTSRRAIDQINAARAKKRGGGDVRGESALMLPGERESCACGFDQLPGLEPTPEVLAMIEEETTRLIDALPNQTLQAIALWKLEGWSHPEIAEKLSCSVRTVERKLSEIRGIWSEALLVRG